MSCSLCRLPFVPSENSIAPRWPPEGLLSQKQLLHFKYALAIGQNIPGLSVNMVYLDGNLFTVDNSPTIITIAWEHDRKTFIAFHTHCAILFRHHAGLASDSQDASIELSLLERVISPPQGLARAGRFEHFDYEGVLGGGAPRIDIESLWCPGEGEGLNDFDWLMWKDRGLQWTATRPDIFPRFHPTVRPKRLAAVGPLPTAGTTDVITNLPHDVLVLLLAHPALSDASFVALLGTCRTLRCAALTTLQPLARARVISLGWPLPVPVEHASFAAGKGATAPAELAALEMAHPVHSPAYGDWMLYLSQVHRTQAMRARRWVWALAKGLARVRAERRAASKWADLPRESGEDEDAPPRRSDAWKRYATQMKPMIEMSNMMRLASENGGQNFKW